MYIAYKKRQHKNLKVTETPDIINELFKSFLRRYQEGLETKMKGSSDIFESVDLLYYHLHKISLEVDLSRFS